LFGVIGAVPAIGLLALQPAAAAGPLRRTREIETH
jgi:hypothetical protein